MPTASRRVAGTKTRQPPFASTYRYGFSRLTGVLGRVVYVGSGRLCAGAPEVPENTWFQTALLQPPPRLLPRT
ncbi:hypothetical protein GCM10025868_17090 [Angustibacter aerolatus]|uniref:Uncharacterized protein n=1 Tax=Angustibacter aerolatus TaxID=1162965 RepID=A0ABQ6JF78_9ACTN|nr:hypothetical protein GCM10025868_17090 [Angustibacter aerolatus]